MTIDSPANKVLATVESARLGRRHEESARFFALVSFPISGNEQLMLTLAKNIKNPVELGFGVIQAELLPPPPETEEVDMVVAGEPAKVRRPTRLNGHSPEEELSAAAQALIDQAEGDDLSRKPPENEDQAREQAEAERRLLGRT